MDEMVIKALYVELLKSMLNNINQASTARAHNHIKLLFALSELTGLRSQRLEILPKWQTLARACFSALDGLAAVEKNDYARFEQYDAEDWGRTKELCRDYLGMFGVSTH